MPKRKALGPADSSDGEDGDEFYSFPATPIHSPFPKIVSNNFNLPFPQKTPVTAATSTSIFGLGGGSSKRSLLGKTPFFGLNKPQAPPLLTNVDTLSTSSNSASGSSNQELSKSMRDLNNAFTNSVRNSVSKNASHSLLPLVKDYLFHSRVLLEQCKRGGTKAELVNGINLPPKTFKSLGEFFDDFEARYVESSPEDTPREDASTSFSSALNSKFLPTTETSSKSNFTSTFSTIPSKPAEKIVPVTQPETISIKVNSLSSNNDSSPSKLETERPAMSGFFANTISSSTNPLQTTSTLTSTSPLKSSSTESASPVTKPANTVPFSGFSFFTPPAPSTSITLGSFPTTTTTTTASNSEEKNNDEDGEDEEPPKVEVTPVKEDDAVYSIRCKVFGVVDGKCKDKGIGMLYVKKLEDGRYQIVVRADNNLGTVLLNILLQKSLPLEKNGKNSIMTVDLQANDKKGMPIFIRVKTEEDAIKLLETLKEYQKSS